MKSKRSWCPGTYKGVLTRPPMSVWLGGPPKISSSMQHSQTNGLIKFEEIWLGHRRPPQTHSQWSKQTSMDMEASSNGNGRNDSTNSPLPMLEDSCDLNLEELISSGASNKCQRANMSSINLFNQCTDHGKSEIQTTGNNSPYNELTLPVCTNDAWMLLQEFEAFSDLDNMTMPQLPPPFAHCRANAMENTDLSSKLDLFPDITQLNELIQLTSPETLSLDSSVLNDGILLSCSDANNDTSDILAHLITDNILADSELANSELEGLLSNTLLDFNTVLGQTLYGGTDLNNVAEQSMQEVPQVALTVESLKRNPESVDDRLREEDSTSSDIKYKKRKTESPSCSPSPSPSLSSDCNDDRHNVKYLRMRQKNNEASKKSRYTRKQKHRTMEQEVSHLEEENKRLRDKAEQLEKTVTALKTSLMKHILDLKSQN